MQNKVEDLLKEIAKKYNKPLHVILEIYNSQFKMTRDSISSLEFKTIKLPSWGKYIPSQDKLSKIDYKAKEERKAEKYGRASEGNKDNSIQGS